MNYSAQKLGYGLTRNNKKSAAANEENNNVTSSSFQVGQRVRARFAGKGHFYNGKITSDNGDGTYGIEYDDGDWEDELNGEFIQTIEKIKIKKPASSSTVVEEEQFVVNTVDPKEISNENNINIVNTSSDKQKVVEEAQKLGYGLTTNNKKSAAANEENNNVTSSSFQVGQRVRARFAGKGHFYNGKITSDNGDGTYGIEYDDGDWEDELNGEFIQAINIAAGKNDKKIHVKAEEIVANALNDVDVKFNNRNNNDNSNNNKNVVIRNNNNNKKDFSKTWDAGRVPIVMQEEEMQQQQQVQNNTYAGAGNVGDQNMAPDDDGFLRPKSRRGRAKPIKPTGRYPWQKPDESEEEEEGPSHVTFVDTQSPPKPGKSESPKRNKKKKKQASVSPIHRISATNLDSFVERNVRAVAYNPSSKNSKPKPPPPPRAGSSDDENDNENNSSSSAKIKRYSKIPPWSTSVKPDTFNVKAKQHASRESKSPKRRGGKKKIKVSFKISSNHTYQIYILSCQRLANILTCLSEI